MQWYNVYSWRYFTNAVCTCLTQVYRWCHSELLIGWFRSRVKLPKSIYPQKLYLTFHFFQHTKAWPFLFFFLGMKPNFDKNFLNTQIQTTSLPFSLQLPIAGWKSAWQVHYFCVYPMTLLDFIPSNLMRHSTVSQPQLGFEVMPLHLICISLYL